MSKTCTWTFLNNKTVIFYYMLFFGRFYASVFCQIYKWNKAKLNENCWFERKKNRCFPQWHVWHKGAQNGLQTPREGWNYPAGSALHLGIIEFSNRELIGREIAPGLCWLVISFRFRCNNVLKKAFGEISLCFLHK